MNFEPFCGHDKPVERPGSRVEQELAAKRRYAYALRDSGGPRKLRVVLLRAGRLRRDKRVTCNGSEKSIFANFEPLNFLAARKVLINLQCKPYFFDHDY